MRKRMICLLVIAAVFSVAAAPSSAPATRPSSQELLALAVEWMRQGQMQKAKPLLEEAGKDVPPNERTRPFVLNRAIVDVSLKANATRAVKELGDYLRVHRDMDEEATNILGAALDLTARDPKFKAGKLWQTAFVEWERRNYELENARPGYHRYAAKWITQEKFDEMTDQRKQIEAAIRDKEELAQRAEFRAGSARIRTDQATYTINTLSGAIADDYNLSNSQRLIGRQRAGTLTPTTGPMWSQNGPERQGWEEARDSVIGNQIIEGRRAEQERRNAIAEADGYRADIARLRRQLPVPGWPKSFKPIEVASLAPPPLPPPDPKAAAAAAKDKEKNQPGGWADVFGDPAAPIQPSGANPVTRPSAAPATQPEQVAPLAQPQGLSLPPQPVRPLQQPQAR